jgi:ribosomal protein L32
MTKAQATAQPEQQPRELCAYCRFYRNEGECRRNAPQATFQNDTQSRRATFQLTWPRVKPGDWCGEWEARPA